MSTTASKHMVLWGGHVGHVWLVWLDGYVGIGNPIHMQPAGSLCEYMVHECLKSSLAFRKPAVAAASRRPARADGPTQQHPSAGLSAGLSTTWWTVHSWSTVRWTVHGGQ